MPDLREWPGTAFSIYLAFKHQAKLENPILFLGLSSMTKALGASSGVHEEDTKA